jgi:predicted DNA-binding transcriptional regulator AlpA
MNVDQRELTLETLFTEKQVSRWLGISIPSLQRMRSSGCGPAFVQLSARRIGYRKSTIEAWLSARTINRVGELAASPCTPNSSSGCEQCQAAAENRNIAP